MMKDLSVKKNPKPLKLIEENTIIESLWQLGWERDSLHKTSKAQTRKKI